MYLPPSSQVASEHLHPALADGNWVHTHAPSILPNPRMKRRPPLAPTLNLRETFPFDRYSITPEEPVRSQWQHLYPMKEWTGMLTGRRRKPGVLGTAFVVFDEAFCCLEERDAVGNFLSRLHPGVSRVIEVRNPASGMLSSHRHVYDIGGWTVPRPWKVGLTRSLTTAIACAGEEFNQRCT